MKLIYERCGNCGRKGVYQVVGRGIVRCKYCCATGPDGPGPDGAPPGAGAIPSARGERPGRPGSSPPESDGVDEATEAPRAVLKLDPQAMALIGEPSSLRHRSSSASARASDEAPAPGTRARSTRVLVIEDDDDVRAVVGATLTRAGMVVTGAPDGPAGLRAVAADPPDVVVLDLNLPGMDGLAVMVELKQRCDAAVVVLSGRSQEGDRVVGTNLGADDYLAKPFSGGALVDSIEGLRAKQRLPTAP